MNQYDILTHLVRSTYKTHVNICYTIYNMISDSVRLSHGFTHFIYYNV